MSNNPENHLANVMRNFVLESSGIVRFVSALALACPREGRNAGKQPDEFKGGVYRCQVLNSKHSLLPSAYLLPYERSMDRWSSWRAVSH